MSATIPERHGVGPLPRGEEIEILGKRLVEMYDELEDAILRVRSGGGAATPAHAIALVNLVEQLRGEGASIARLGEQLATLLGIYVHEG
jgi:hypothetical protein